MGVLILHSLTPQEVICYNCRVLTISAFWVTIYEKSVYNLFILLVIMNIFTQRSKYAKAFAFIKWELDFMFGKMTNSVMDRTLDYESNNGHLILSPLFTVLP